MGCDFYRRITLIVEKSVDGDSEKITHVLERDKIYDFFNDQVEYKTCTCVYEKNNGFINHINVVDVYDDEMPLSYIKELCNRYTNDLKDVVSIYYCDEVFPR